MEENLRAAVSLPYLILLKLENKSFSDSSCLLVSLSSVGGRLLRLSGPDL